MHKNKKLLEKKDEEKKSKNEPVDVKIYSDIQKIDIDKVYANPNQPRKNFDKESLNELAEKVGGRVIRFTEWIPYLEQIDIVIVSTASPVYVVGPAVLSQTQATRQGRPLFLIDLSVPRNVDPSCADLPGVSVHDIDTLQNLARQSHDARQSEIERAESIIEEWLAENMQDLFMPRNSYTA